MTELTYHNITAEEARCLLKTQGATELVERIPDAGEPHRSHTIKAFVDGGEGHWDEVAEALVLWLGTSEKPS